MPVHPSIDALASYLPRRLVEQLAGAVPSPTEGAPDTFPAASFLADLTGFTALTSDLSTEGAEGAERLTQIVQHCLGGLVDLVYETGGDVMNFAGDAVIAVWPAEDAEGLRAAVYRAAECAVRAQDYIRGWDAHPGHQLSLRIGIAAGPCTLMSLGDDQQRWGWVAAGPAMTEVGRAERTASPGTTVLSARAAQLLAGLATGRANDSGGVVLEALRPHEFPAEGPAASVSEAAIDEELLAGAIRAYLPAAVVPRLEAQQSDWIAELRQISTVFVNLPSLDPSQPGDDALARDLVGKVKGIIDLLGGTLNKILVDDKGMTIVLAFGLPPLSHEDDEVRAVRCAMRMSRALIRMGIEHGVGVSTGRAFCGVYGNDLRREYTMLGDSVNLAARLMQLARDTVWCDSETTRAALSRFQFEDLGLRTIKGKAEPERVHSPTGALDSTGRNEVLLTGRNEVLLTGRVDVLATSSWDVLSQNMTPVTESDAVSLPPEPRGAPLPAQRLVGRESQQQVLEERLERLQQGERGLVLIEGEAGMGKSLLAATLQRAAWEARVPLLVGSADPVRSLEPYHAWKEVFAALLGLRAKDGDNRLERFFPEGSHLAGWVPLLAPILGIDMAETEATRAMNGPQRAYATRDLFVAALSRATEDAPLLVVLDDGHWLDSASWDLVLAAARAVPDLLLVLGHRPLTQNPPPAFVELLATPGIRRIRLDALPDSSVADLACKFLGSRELSRDVEKFVVARAAGNPFFCEEMVHALREAEAIEIVAGVAHFAAGHSAGSVDLPGTLQGVLTSRLDRLPQGEQLTLKIASVLGRTFSVDALMAMHPVGATREELSGHLDHLAEVDLCPVERDGETKVHAFKHILVQEACYELLVLSKRRALHAAAAAYFEGRGDPARQNAALLAHHWTRAGEPLRALHHLERAGFEALDNGADHDALATLESAQKVVGSLSATQRIEVDPVREAEVLRAIGTALHGVGRNDESADSLRAAMGALGRSFPATTAGWVLRLLFEGARQLVYRVLPRWLRWNARVSKRPALEAASRAASWYANASYFRVDALSWLAAGLMSANLAEDAAAPEIAGTAYVNLANIFGTLHLRRIERAYMKLAALSPERRVEIIGHSSVAVVDMLHCDWDAARASIDLGTEKARAAGDWWALGNGLTIRALIASFTGPIGEALPVFDETARLMRQRNLPAQEGYGLVFSVPALLSMGKVDTAWEQLEQGRDQLDEYDYFGRLSWHAAGAAVHDRRGEIADAVPEALTALRMYAEKPLMLFTYAGPLLAVAEVLLGAAERGASVPGASLDEIRRGAKQAVARLGQGAMTFGYFVPRHLLAQGIAAALAGKTGAAVKAWTRGIAAAEARGMPWDAARIHLEVARRSPAGSSARTEHAAAARAILEPMGAVGDLELLP
jgi:class 3 adenylate cyclase